MSFYNKINVIRCQSSADRRYAIVRQMLDLFILKCLRDGTVVVRDVHSDDQILRTSLAAIEKQEAGQVNNLELLHDAPWFASKAIHVRQRNRPHEPGRPTRILRLAMENPDCALNEFDSWAIAEPAMC